MGRLTHGRGTLLTNVTRIGLLAAFAIAFALPASAQSPHPATPSPTNPTDGALPAIPMGAAQAKSGGKAIGTYLGSFVPSISGYPTALASSTGTPTSDLAMTSFDPNELHLITPDVSGPTLFTTPISSTTTNAASGVAINFESGGSGLPTVFISDAANAEIDVYDGAGVFLYSFPIAGGFFAEGCTFNPNTGHIYVVDIGSPDVIRQYTPSGTLVQTYALSGTPSLAMDGLAYDNKRNMFWAYNRVADIVQYYDPSFNLTHSFSPNVIGITGSRGEGIGVVGNVLYIASWTTGSVLRFDISTIDQPTCSSFKTFVLSEWPLLQADLDLPGIHTPATPGRRIPERYALGMVEAIFCLESHPEYDGAVQAYETNLALLDAENEPELSRVAPYKHALAALLMVGQPRRDYFVAELGLNNLFVTAMSTGGKTTTEPFSDEGDLDSDTVSNGDEYDNTISDGGTMSEFLVAVLNPALMGGALPALDIPFIALLVILVVAVSVSRFGYPLHPPMQSQADDNVNRREN